MTRKLLVRDAKGERELLLVGTMLVGRDPACDISANDSMLSRQHASFNATPEGVVVRDLKSRNGILVNGLRTEETMLFPGDVVQVAGFTIRYVDAAEPAVAGEPETNDDDDKTVVVGRNPPPSAGAGARAFPAEEDDGTVIVGRSGPAGGGAAPAPAPDPGTIVMPGATGRVASRPTASAVATADESDTARMAGSARQGAAGAAGAIHSAPAARAAAVTSLQAPAAAARKKRRALLGWNVRVFVSIVALSGIVFLLAVVPLNISRNNVLEATAEARASALLNWLAADAAAALQTGRGIPESANAVSEQPGVVSALVIGTDGRVKSPGARSTESVSTIPVLDVAPGEVRRTMTARNGDVLEIARPVRTADGTVAVAWVTFRPSVPPGAEGTALTWFPALVVAIVGGVMVAGAVRRSAGRALAAMNEQIDLAINGQGTEVLDPLGLPASRQLTESVNYLLERTRSEGVELARPQSTGRAAALPADVPSRSVRSAPARQVTASQPAAASPVSGIGQEGRLVANDKFRITEASPGCAGIVGGNEKTFIGEHLIDAIPDQQVVDAVLKCLGAVAAGGTERATVTAATGALLEIVVARAGKDQPVTVTFKTLPAGAA